MNRFRERRNNKDGAWKNVKADVLFRIHPREGDRASRILL